MRDLIITLIVFGLMPWVFMRPYIGALLYAWLGLMNPHRLTWGFAYSFPFSSIVALATIAATLISSEKKKIPWNGALVILILFVGWMNVSTYFSLLPEAAMPEWDRAMKIQLMIFVTLLLMHGHHRINAFVWVIAMSIGFYGIKGGVFTAITGGQYLVMGPWDSFITDNNTLALALIMVLPLMRYLMVVSTGKNVRRFLLLSMILTTMAIASTHSRGALLAGAVILLFLIVKSPYRARFLVVASVAVAGVLLFMPDVWWERMGTIANYQQDASAMGRINAWMFAFNVASDFPLTGGGFNVFDEQLFLQYAPNPTDFHDAHSIYFEVLGEQGFVGLSLFLLLGILTYLSCSRVIRMSRDHEELTWARDLASMLQVSLVGYAAGGAFLGLAYYDLYYNLIALSVLLDYHVRNELAEEPAEVEDPVDSGIAVAPTAPLQSAAPAGPYGFARRVDR
jgi:probable O-glycosylation ligase (exosortase A-associated)